MSESLEQQPLTNHLVELRKRLLWSLMVLVIASGLCYVFVQDIYGLLVRPLATQDGAQRLIYTGLTEAFFTYMKLAFFSGLFLTLPILLIQIWKFVAPGLYKNEKGALLPFMIATPVLFICGASVVYFIVMPMAWPFFLSFQSSSAETVLPIQLEARVSEYLDLIITLIFAFGVCFQLPVLLVLLGRAGIISVDTLKKGRKYAIVLTFIVAAILTPPDIISQIILAVPVLGLYEISILLISKQKFRNESSPIEP